MNQQPAVSQFQPPLQQMPMQHLLSQPYHQQPMGPQQPHVSQSFAISQPQHMQMQQAGYPMQVSQQQQQIYHQQPPNMYPPQPVQHIPIVSQSGQPMSDGSGQLQQQQPLQLAERSVAEMEARGMTNDARYAGMVALSNRIRTGPVDGVVPPHSVATPPAVSAPPFGSQLQFGQEPPYQPQGVALLNTIDPSSVNSGDAANAMTPEQLYRLKSQISAYRYLSRNQSIPVSIAESVVATGGTSLSLASGGGLEEPKKAVSLLPEPFSIPGPTIGNVKLPYNLLGVLNSLHAKQNRITPVQKPVGIDPEALLKERENIIANRIGLRIQELEKIPANVDEDLRIALEIELRSLRLVNFQKQLRSSLVSCIRKDTTLETALNPRAYRRTKKQSLREARVTEQLEKRQKLEQENRRKVRHKEWIESVLQHAKDFKEYHKENRLKMMKLKKSIVQYHQNTERERRKEEERREKERLAKLMVEDEEGYRQLLDQKKDKRLVYLLQQTDEYITNIVGLVKEHQEQEAARIKAEKTAEKTARRELKKQQHQLTMINAGVTVTEDDTSRTSVDMPIKVMQTAGGKILSGVDAPKASQLEAWLEMNPGWQVLARDEHAGDGHGDSSDNSSDDEDDEKAKQQQLPIIVHDKNDSETKKILEDENLDEETKNRRIIQAAHNEEDDAPPPLPEGDAAIEGYYDQAHRNQEKIESQPKCLVGGTLKEYQLRGLHWMVSLYNNNLNGILADEMGLGKTIQSIALVCHLMERKKINGPFLIVVPLSTMSNWDLEFDKWAPSVVKIIYKGTANERKAKQAEIIRNRFNVVLTTYEYIIRDKAVLARQKWKHLIIDEGHRMKNHHCKLTMILNTYYSSPHRILLTGTPLQNKLPELWALLNFLLPSIFKSCSSFEQWFNAPFANTGEKVELNQEETMLIIRRLHKVLRPFLLRRLKKEVESQLPDKTEYVIKCDMSALQRVIYTQLQNNGVLIREDNEEKKGMRARALMNIVMQLRKICNHPFLFHDYERMYAKHLGLNPDDPITGAELYRSSGKFELLDRILPKLMATNHRCLIFCQMTLLMDIMEDYFRWRGFNHLRLDGSTKADLRAEAVKEFNNANSKYFVFLLSTRAGGLGLNLQTADTVIIFDSDWNPFQDMQAQARAHRIGQVNEVRVLRLVTVNSVEEKILAAARYKLNIDEKVIQAGLFDNKSTGNERKQFLQAILLADDDLDEEEDEIPDDETINQMISRGEEEFWKFRDMDMERRRKDALDAQGRKPRLIELEELPPHLQDENIGTILMEEQHQEKMGEGQGRRQRKEVDYSQDSWSDKQWLKAMEEDVDGLSSDEEEASTSNSPKVKKLNSKGKEQKQKSSVKGRPRKRVYMDDEDDEPELDGASTSSKRTKTEDLNEKWQKMISEMLCYIDEDDRRICDVFYQLPTRRELPFYYQVIGKPMDFKRIETKIAKDKYINVDEIETDIFLLCDNAMEYNEEGSQIYLDAESLKEIWSNIRARSEGRVVEKKVVIARPRIGDNNDDSLARDSTDVKVPQPLVRLPPTVQQVQSTVQRHQQQGQMIASNMTTANIATGSVQQPPPPSSKVITPPTKEEHQQQQQPMNISVQKTQQIPPPLRRGPPPVSSGVPIQQQQQLQQQQQQQQMPPQLSPMMSQMAAAAGIPPHLAPLAAQLAASSGMFGLPPQLQGVNAAAMNPLMQLAGMGMFTPQQAQQQQQQQQLKQQQQQPTEISVNIPPPPTLSRMSMSSGQSSGNASRDSPNEADSSIGGGRRKKSQPMKRGDDAIDGGVE